MSRALSDEINKNKAFDGWGEPNSKPEVNKQKDNQATWLNSIWQ